jgi:hypothetical protein
VIGYNLYRATISGGPYTKINPSIDATTTFTDAGTVQAGKIYYWVVTAVNSSNVESVHSGEVSATIPFAFCRCAGKSPGLVTCLFFVIDDPSVC